MGYQLQIKTSYVSPVTLETLTKNGYLPIFIIRNISNSDLIGKYSGTAVHFRCLAPSTELFRAKRDGLIDLEEFAKRYIIEMSEINLTEVIGKLNYLCSLSGAKGVVLMGYGSDDTVCHRSILRSLLNESGLLNNYITELIL